MSNNKLVSVITGTYNRPFELTKAIESVREQVYPNIEHCIVHDGPAPQTVRDIVSNENNHSNVPIKFVETGRQWSHFLANSISAVPYQVAQWLASGDYLMWFADDELITPDHISSLVELLEREDVDFVYSKSEIWFNPEVTAKLKFRLGATEIGGELRCGNITQALYRVELLDYRGFMTDVGSGTDWDQVDAWLKAGASHAFLDRATHSHRVDKLGDRELNKTKRQLRGKVNSEKLAASV